MSIDKTQELDIHLFDWFEQFTQSPHEWGDIESDNFPFKYLRLKPEIKAVNVERLIEIEWVQWLFFNNSPAIFALVTQNEEQRDTMLPPIFSLRSWFSETNRCRDSLYATGFVYKDELLGVEFKLRFGELLLGM